jgi:hypothetical protein
MYKQFDWGRLEKDIVADAIRPFYYIIVAFDEYL